LPELSTKRGNEDGVLSSGSIAKLAGITDSEKSPKISKINLNTPNSNFYHTKAFSYNIVGVKMPSFKIPYGKNEISFETPSEFKIITAKSKSKPKLSNIEDATANALIHPINSKPLSEMIEKDDTICIIVTDITRNCPDKEILQPLIEEIKKKVKQPNLKLLIASGMHRSMSYSEKIEKFGENILKNYQIIDHDARDKKNLISFGNTKNGTPITLSKHACDADFLISIGVVEPHQYAGYSGGYKTVAIGVAGDDTISYTHSRKFIEHQKTRIGNVDGNIFNDDIIEIGTKAGLDFIINVIFNDEKNVVDIKAGEPLETYKTLVLKAKEISEITLSKPYDVVICGIGYPKDANLYQTSRAASYLFYLPTPVVKNGGYIIIPAICQEGPGNGVGEKRFFEMLKNMTLEEILNHKNEFKAGEQRAFMMANVLKHCKVIIVGSTTAEIIKATKMIPATTMDEAFEIVKNDIGKDLELLLIPNSLLTLPIIK